MVMKARNIYHPVAIGADFVRKNKFELIVTGAGINLDSISLLCKNVTLTLPNTNAVPIPWIGGVMQVAGRVSQAFSFTAGFYVGQDMDYDAFRTVYDWRNIVFNHETGETSLANAYKQTGNLLIYDMASELKYNIQIDGMWPVNIPDINFAVEDDGILDLSVQFAADRIWMVEAY